VIREAADEYGAGTASWYDAFNGTDHDEDPVEKGYIGPDGMHQSLVGQKVQAEVLHALGYAPIIPKAYADNRPRPRPYRHPWAAMLAKQDVSGSPGLRMVGVSRQSPRSGQLLRRSLQRTSNPLGRHRQRMPPST